MMTIRNQFNRNLLAIAMFCAPSTSAFAEEFKLRMQPFLENYCIDCHDDATQKGGVSLHDLDGVTYENAGLWKVIWEQVALDQMPPKKKKNQPEPELRLEVSNWITNELSKSLAPKGGFHEHLLPSKANHLNHDLIFGRQHNNLKPSSSPARLWRIDAMEHLVRLNALITNEPEYDPTAPGKRARGDILVHSLMGDLKVFYGLDRYLGHLNPRWAYILRQSVSGFPAIFGRSLEHGLRSYADMHAVQVSESTSLLSTGESILNFMAYGPQVEPFQFIDEKDVKDTINKSGEARKGNGATPLGSYYSKEIKRPLTPVYELMNEPGVSDARLLAAINYLFEALTLKKPTAGQSDFYLKVVKKSIDQLGKEKGTLPALALIFIDPNALYRTELAMNGEPDAHGRVMLQDQELVLAINHAFAYIMHDDKLHQASEAGNLKSREDVKREVTRILNDDSIRKPRILQFFREYFGYDFCADISKPLNPEELNMHLSAMYQAIANTDRLVELILEEDKDVLKQLLTTDRVIYGDNDQQYYWDLTMKKNVMLAHQVAAGRFISSKKRGEPYEEYIAKQNAYNEKRDRQFKHIFPGEKTSIEVRIAQIDSLKTGVSNDPDFFYWQHGGSKTKTLTRVNTSQRMGILTQPSWLISHSEFDYNNAIRRGKWIRERLLGGAIPEVPVTVEAILPDEPKSLLRHRMRVTRESECWRCHDKMDPIGLPFEMYDFLGRYRQTEHGKSIDTSGEIMFSGDPKLDGKVTDAIDMMKKLAESERVEQVFVRHVFRFWMGRNETIHDAHILQEAHKAYKDSNGSMKALLTSLLTSDAFLYRTVTK